MIAAIVIAAITPIVLLSLALLRDDSQTYRFVIALGTGAALVEGRPVDNALPKSLSIKVGDTVEIINQDSQAHTYAFMVLRPGETVRHTFRQVGTFIGECTANEHEEVTITVS
ncbi:MAG: hypothetical protein RIR69_744 [Actinomycetota bacterium]